MGLHTPLAVQRARCEGASRASRTSSKSASASPLTPASGVAGVRSGGERRNRFTASAISCSSTSTPCAPPLSGVVTASITGTAVTVTAGATGVRKLCCEWSDGSAVVDEPAISLSRAPRCTNSAPRTTSTPRRTADPTVQACSRSASFSFTPHDENASPALPVLAAPAGQRNVRAAPAVAGAVDNSGDDGDDGNGADAFLGFASGTSERRHAQRGRGATAQRSQRNSSSSSSSRAGSHNQGGKRHEVKRTTTATTTTTTTSVPSTGWLSSSCTALPGDTAVAHDFPCSHHGRGACHNADAAHASTSGRGAATADDSVRWCLGATAPAAAAAAASAAAAADRESGAVGRDGVRGCWTMAPRVCGVNEVLQLTAESSTATATDTVAAAAAAAPLPRGPHQAGTAPTAASAPLLTKAADAFPVWHAPLLLELHRNSAGGTYMVRLAHPSTEAATTTTSTTPSAAAAAADIVAVFKPRDEEIGQECNPHENRESDRTEAFAPGSGSRREVLAYCLDHGHNAGVPPTLEVASAYWTAASGADAGRSGRHRALVSQAPTAATAAAEGGINTSTCTLGFVTAAAAAATAVPGAGPRHAEGVHASRNAVAAAWVGEEEAREGRAVPTHAQVGSLQLFVPGCQEAADVLPGHFDTDEVHALAIFDIRTLNGDRHGGNVLVQNYQRRRRACGGSGVDTRCSSPMGRSSPHSPVRRRPPGPRNLADDIFPSTRAQNDAGGEGGEDEVVVEERPHLIPIDHSYICPSGYADPDYEWLAWPQAKRPFSARNLAYIAALDADADAELVRAALLAHGYVNAHRNRDDDAESGDEGGDGGGRASEALHAEVRRVNAGGTAAASPPCGALLMDDGVQRARAPTRAYTESKLAFTAAGRAPELALMSLDDLTVSSPPRAQAAATRGGASASSTTSVLSRVRAWDVATTSVSAARAHIAHKDNDAAAAAARARAMDAAWSPSASSASSSSASSAASAIDSSTIASTSQEFDTLDMEAEAALMPVTYDRDAADAAAEVIRCTTRLLQIAALEFGMTAYDIGGLCRRPRVAQASVLEEVVEEARDELTWELVWPRFDAVVRERLSSAAARASV